MADRSTPSGTNPVRPDPIRPSPIRSADAEAIALARGLLHGARSATLGTLDPDTGGPLLSRIGLGVLPDGSPLAFLSDIALHSRALAADPRAGLLLGEAGPRGDPLTHPRLSLTAHATFIEPDTARRLDLRELWLAGHPKAKLYMDFADFRFVHFQITGALLNAGFAKAYALAPVDFMIG